MRENEPSGKEEAGNKPASFSLEVALSTALVGLCNYLFDDEDLRRLLGTLGAALGYFAARLLRWLHVEFVLWRLGKIIEQELRQLRAEQLQPGLSVKRTQEIGKEIAQRQRFLTEKRINNLDIK